MGANDPNRRLQHLKFSSTDIKANPLCGSMAGSPIHTATSGALAVMECAGCWDGPLCAAPTSGSAGTVPGCLYSLSEHGFSRDEVTDALAVMALAGGIIAKYATF